ncbi:hypothetical protein F5B20DRAFT_557794 [Whalleya microplaca]|nr:hypothetical protein F5B20DRAFT_557794 [Whalleya microplaca]
MYESNRPLGDKMNDKQEVQASLEVSPYSELPQVVQPYLQAPADSPTSGYTHSAYQQAPNPGNTDANIGLKDKKRFWRIFALVIIVLLVIALAVGLGVGLGTRSNHSTAQSEADTTNSPTTAGSTPSSSTSTPLACPADANATTQSADNEAFTVLCGVDYSGKEDSANKDLDNMVLRSAEECIDVCASNNKCVGAGWGEIDGSGKTYCYMKSAIGKQNTADANWMFVQRVQSS